MTESIVPSNEDGFDVLKDHGKGKVMSNAIINALRQMRMEREEAARLARQQSEFGGSGGSEEEHEMLSRVPEFHDQKSGH